MADEQWSWPLGRWIFGNPLLGFLLFCWVLAMVGAEVKEFLGIGPPSRSDGEGAMASLPPDGFVPEVAFSPTTNQLATANWGKVTLWGAPEYTSEVAALPHDELFVTELAFSPAGNVLAAADTRSVRLWDTSSHALLGLAPGGQPIGFSGDGRLLATTNGDQVTLWDLTTHQEVATFGHDGDVLAMAISPNGMLATSSRNRDTEADPVLRLWDLGTHRRIVTLPEDEGDYVGSMAFSPDGRLLAVGGGDTVRLWDPSTHEKLATLHLEDWVLSVAFSRDGKRLATATGRTHDGTVTLWDPATRTEIRWVHDHDHNRVDSVSLSSDGALLATTERYGMGEDSTVHVWGLPPPTGGGVGRLRGRHEPAHVGRNFCKPSPASPNLCKPSPAEWSIDGT